MLKARPSLALCVIPLLIAGGVHSTPKLIAADWRIVRSRAPHSLSPERMMAVAQTFERQGHLAKAKEVYNRILAKRPDFDEARRRLESIAAAEQRGTQTTPQQAVARHNGAERPATEKSSAAPGTAQTIAAGAAQKMRGALEGRPAQTNPQGIAPQSPANAVASETTNLIQSKQDSIAAGFDDRESAAGAAGSRTTVENAFGVGLSRDETPGSRSSCEELARSPELRPFHGAPHKQVVAMLQERRDELTPHLVEVVAGESFDVKDRSLAAFLLGELGPEAAGALPTLRETMRTCQDSILQIEVAQVIVLIQPEDTEAIQTLLEQLHAEDDTVKWYAALALRNCASPRTAFVVDALLETLNSENDRVRRMAILTLGAFGPAATKAVPDLEAALNSTDYKTRQAAEAALATIVADRASKPSLLQDPQSN